MWHMGTGPPRPTAARTRCPRRPGTPSFPSLACRAGWPQLVAMGDSKTSSAVVRAVSPPLPPMQVPGEVPGGPVRAGLPGEL